MDSNGRNATLATANQDLLAADTAMGPVTLSVADLDTMTAYYRDGTALDVLSEGPGTVTLGRGSTPVVILQHAPELTYASRSEAGLFHTAILYDTKEALAAAVYSVATNYPGTFTGSSDHLVSNAFYFNDPEGNGVELYWDRERSAWSWIHGSVEMATIFLDPNKFLQENLTEQAAAEPRVGEARIGHIHLQVGDIPSARDFYVDKLGFEQTLAYGPQALFVSAGGYHHHMAMNTWNSAGAAKRKPTLGLGQVQIDVPGADDLGELAERMRHYGFQTRDDGRELAFDDPWNNAIRVKAAGA